MGAIALSGNDTVNINGTILADLADGNCVELTFPNDIANVKIGKNGNAIYGLNTTGQMSETKLRIIRGSSDDKFLNGLLVAQQNNFAGTVLAFGQFIKKIGDGQGNITSDTYILSGGIFIKIPEAKTNVEGETEQSISIYTLRWANSPAPRAIT
jgi:hypothetical protein